MSCGPPCPPCTPPSPPVCPQYCAPPPPPPPCRVRPIMRGLHLAQTKNVLIQGCTLAVIAGLCYYAFVGRPRMAMYKDFHAKAETEEWENEMARKGLFQSVPMNTSK